MKISEHLREKIEEAIAMGALAPGTALEEAVLAERYGVSRTPVREALIQLAGEGLVEMRPRRGAVVASIGPARLLEMFEVMAGLEAMCARLAARRMNDAERQNLALAHERCAAVQGDLDAYFASNELFHAAIYAGSHNDVLIEQTSQMHRRLRPYRRLQLRVRDRVRSSCAEHAAIVKAITDGDADGAAQALQDHVTVQGERFGDLLASMRSLHPEPAHA